VSYQDPDFDDFLSTLRDYHRDYENALAHIASDYKIGLVDVICEFISIRESTGIPESQKPLAFYKTVELLLRDAMEWALYKRHGEDV